MRLFGPFEALIARVEVIVPTVSTVCMTFASLNVPAPLAPNSPVPIDTTTTISVPQHAS